MFFVPLSWCQASGLQRWQSLTPSWLMWLWRLPNSGQSGGNPWILGVSTGDAFCCKDGWHSTVGTVLGRATRGHVFPFSWHFCCYTEGQATLGLQRIPCLPPLPRTMKAIRLQHFQKGTESLYKLLPCGWRRQVAGSGAKPLLRTYPFCCSQEEMVLCL